MSAQERRSGSNCSMGQLRPQLFSIPSILTIPSLRLEKAMQNGGRIFSSQWRAATRLKQSGQEGSGAFLLPLVANSRLEKGVRVSLSYCFCYQPSHLFCPHSYLAGFLQVCRPIPCFDAPLYSILNRFCLFFQFLRVSPHHPLT